MFASGDPGVSGDSWGSQEGCQGPLLIATGEAIPLRGLEGVPGLPGAPQDEAGLTTPFHDVTNRHPNIYLTGL